VDTPMAEVEKMAPEEKTILEDVLSLIQQLLASQGGAEAEPMIAEAEEQNMDDPNQAVDLKKAVINENGDTKAEDRLDNQSELTDESLKQIGKSILALMQSKKTVQKSVSNTSNPILNELKKINTMLNNVVKTQQEQEVFNKNMLEAIGYSEEIVAKTLESVTPAKPNPPYQANNGIDLEAIVTAVAKGMSANQQNNPDSGHPINQKRKTVVEKSAADLINWIGTHGQAQRRVG